MRGGCPVRAGKKATARTARRLTFSPPGGEKKKTGEREILDGSAPVETASVSVKKKTATPVAARRRSLRSATPS